jgi:hypothetical protein
MQICVPPFGWSFIPICPPAAKRYAGRLKLADQAKIVLTLRQDAHISPHFLIPTLNEDW